MVVEEQRFTDVYESDAVPTTINWREPRSQRPQAKRWWFELDAEGGFAGSRRALFESAGEWCRIVGGGMVLGALATSTRREQGKKYAEEEGIVGRKRRCRPSPKKKLPIF